MRSLYDGLYLMVQTTNGIPGVTSVSFSKSSNIAIVLLMFQQEAFDAAKSKRVEKRKHQVTSTSMVF